MGNRDRSDRSDRRRKRTQPWWITVGLEPSLAGSVLDTIFPKLLSGLVWAEISGMDTLVKVWDGQHDDFENSGPLVGTHDEPGAGWIRPARAIGRGETLFFYVKVQAWACETGKGSRVSLCLWADLLNTVEVNDRYGGSAGMNKRGEPMSLKQWGSVSREELHAARGEQRMEMVERELVRLAEGLKGRMRDYGRKLRDEL